MYIENRAKIIHGVCVYSSFPPTIDYRENNNSQWKNLEDSILLSELASH